MEGVEKYGFGGGWRLLDEGHNQRINALDTNFHRNRGMYKTNETSGYRRFVMLCLVEQQVFSGCRRIIARHNNELGIVLTLQRHDAYASFNVGFLFRKLRFRAT